MGQKSEYAKVRFYWVYLTLIIRTVSFLVVFKFIKSVLINLKATKQGGDPLSKLTKPYFKTQAIDLKPV